MERDLSRPALSGHGLGCHWSWRWGNGDGDDAASQGGPLTAHGIIEGRERNGIKIVVTAYLRGI
jgi:hypothetical protein